MRYKILIVDDEVEIADMLREFFEMENFLVYTASDGREALQKVEKAPDIILLDINLPEINGLEVCQSIRDHVSCPILFLTARVEECQRIEGLNAGGDDYILKPFSLEELHARVMAHLRGQQRKQTADKVKFQNRICMNYTTRKVFYDKECLEMTRTEYDIIELLSQNPGQVMSKEQIYEHIWGYDKDGDSSIITEHIRRIRGKFAGYTQEPILETVWGVGYRWIG